MTAFISNPNNSFMRKCDDIITAPPNGVWRHCLLQGSVNFTYLNIERIRKMCVCDGSEGCLEGKAGVLWLTV